MKKKEIVKKWWNAEHYLAGEIVECTTELIKHQHGYPNSIMEKYKDEDTCVKKWDEILTKIRDGFKWYYDNDGDFYIWKDGKVPPPSDFIKNPDGTSTMTPTPKGFKLIKDTENIKKFKEAKKLFIEYYENLWD